MSTSCVGVGLRLGVVGAGNDHYRMNLLAAGVLDRVPRLEAVLQRSGNQDGRSGAPSRLRPPATDRGWALALAGAFAVSRVAYFLAGVRFDDSALHPARFTQVQWQILPPDLLRHGLGQSLWNLHSQPPLYNLLCGGLLHLPGGWQTPAGATGFMLLGLLLALVTFWLFVELGVRRPAAFFITVFVVADPAVVLYENWLSWSYPTAVLLTCGAYLLVRWFRRRQAKYAFGSVSCFATAVLVDPTFQWPWLLAVAALTLGAARRHWRRVAGWVAIPLALVAGLYVKDAVQFGSAATSSWLGMNLYQTTLGLAPRGDVRGLVGEGVLDRLATVPAFQPVARYAPLVGSRATGTAALDRRTSALRVPNFDNSVYLAVSRRYLADDLSYIEARPGRYLSAVTLATEVWSLPADQYGWVLGNDDRIAGYSRLYDRVVMLQAEPDGYMTSMKAEFHGTRPAAATISWTAAALTVIDLLLAPVAMLIRRRDRWWLACAGAMWVTVSYSFAVTSFTEVGENMRFRFELGTIPLVLAVVTVQVVARQIRYRGGEMGKSPVRPAPAV